VIPFQQPLRQKRLSGMGCTRNQDNHFVSSFRYMISSASCSGGRKAPIRL
jgi:hypothetical protein